MSLYKTMFNSFTPPPLAKIVTIECPVVCITETLIPDGENYRVHKNRVSDRLVSPELLAEALTAVNRAKEGRISPSASNFLAPSLEFQQQVAQTLATIDDKFSYQAALEKIAAANQPNPEPNPETKE